MNDGRVARTAVLHDVRELVREQAPSVLARERGRAVGSDDVVAQRVRARRDRPGRRGRAAV
jgi:hypothetical protein